MIKRFLNKTHKAKYLEIFHVRNFLILINLFIIQHVDIVVSKSATLQFKTQNWNFLLLWSSNSLVKHRYTYIIKHRPSTERLYENTL